MVNPAQRTATPKDSGHRPIRVTFVMEAALGHVTFLEHLQAKTAERSDIEATWIPLAPEPQGIIEGLPPFSRVWTLRASIRARRLMSRQRGHPDVLFFHTVSPSLFAGRWIAQIPTVISIDATPMNVDEVGEAYNHPPGSRTVEAIKQRLWTRRFRSAQALVAWSKWVERSLLDDYGIDSRRVLVQSPGTPIDRPQATPGVKADPVRLLFVGGAFSRKGGVELLNAFRQLDHRCELDLVTSEDLRGLPPRVRLHRGLTTESPVLRDLYKRAHIFVLPTKADTWGHAVVEAMAAGLPVVTTSVGALGEIVTPDHDGLTVEPGNDKELAATLRSLVSSPELRGRLGRAARQTAETRFDAQVNLAKILDTVASCARPCIN